MNDNLDPKPVDEVEVPADTTEQEKELVQTGEDLEEAEEVI